MFCDQENWEAKFPELHVLMIKSECWDLVRLEFSGFTKEPLFHIERVSDFEFCLVVIRRLSDKEEMDMERFLSAIVSEVQAGGNSLLVTIKIAVLPIAKVFTMCFLGFLMASKYVNILPASGRKLLNGVCLHKFHLICTLNRLCIVFWFDVLMDLSKHDD